MVQEIIAYTIVTACAVYLVSVLLFILKTKDKK